MQSLAPAGSALAEMRRVHAIPVPVLVCFSALLALEFFVE